MNWFADPTHIWGAVVVFLLTSGLHAVVSLLGVKALLDRFLAQQRDILAASALQASSIDGVLTIHSGQIKEHDGRITKLERERLDRASVFGELDGRVRVLEARRPGQVA
jgi:hypothetical protein